MEAGRWGFSNQPFSLSNLMFKLSNPSEFPFVLHLRYTERSGTAFRILTKLVRVAEVLEGGAAHKVENPS